MTQNSVTALVEIPAMSRIKYEMDKETGRIFVDRFLKAPMYYPCNYGSIPKTLAGDGDELDILVMTPEPVQAGVYIFCRPIGVLHMQDEKGEDDKIIALPLDEYLSIHSIEDFEKAYSPLLESLRYFFEHYKDLDKDKWVRVKSGFGDKAVAEKLIQQAIDAYSL